MEADYILDYDVLSRDQEHHLYLLARIKARHTDESAKRPPLNISAVIDRSGSMRGDKLTYVKNAAEFLIQQFSADDRFSLVAYDDTVSTIIPPGQVLYKDNLSQAVQRIKVGGSTNLSGGWLQGCNLVAEGISEKLPPHVDNLEVNNLEVNNLEVNEEAKALVPIQVSRVLLLTDGLANQGIKDQGRLGAMAHQKREEGIQTTTMGVGTDFNEDLLVQMASEGGGKFYFIDNPDQIPGIFADELQHLLEVIGQNLVITLVLSPDVQFVQQLNDYPAERHNREVRFKLGDLSSGEIKLLLLQIHIPELKSLGEVEVARLRFDYDEFVGDKVYHRSLELPVMVNAVAPSDYEEAPPRPEVTKRALLLKAAHARKKAVDSADKGDFKQASHVLSKAADNIDESGLEDDDLRHEHNRLREEAVDMELGAERYDSFSRKVSTSRIAGVTRELTDLYKTDLLRDEQKQTRRAIERNGETPTMVKWNEETFELAGDTIKVGRHSANDIIITGSEGYVSKFHCEITRENGDLYIEDLGSTNGTFINGGKLEGRFRLSVGDVMTIGKCFFMFIN